MAKKVIKFKEALQFAREGGYIFAVYCKRDNNYILKDSAYMSDIYEDTNIIVDVEHGQTNFNKFITEDKQYCFRLHNNFNVPSVIPIIKRSNND